MTRITVIQTAFLGDVILTLPLLAAIRKQWPDIEIQFVTRPEAVSVIETAPRVTSTIAYDKRGSERGLSGWWQVRNKIRAFHPDIVLCPHRSSRSVLLAWHSGAEQRIGFDRAARVPGLTTRIKYRTDAHETARLLDLLEPWTHHQGTGTIPELTLTKQDCEFAESHLTGSSKWIAIAPGAVWNTKRYPIERYVETAERLSQDGFRIVAIGGPADEKLCTQIADKVNGLSLAGKAKPRESAAVLQRCQLLITNDSAPLHLAQGVGTRTLAIFGATSPQYGFGPQGPNDNVIGLPIPCRPCRIHGGNQCPEKHFRCMLDLKPELIVETARRMLTHPN